ncbi:MAG TPA: DUF1906 domain-containing protein [Streptosporangiaceae bacterium]|jgi:hypothetical protein|nr:DUF1906 domain-containing protein [Streptosporangiaceae bacterium]
MASSKVRGAGAVAALALFALVGAASVAQAGVVRAVAASTRVVQYHGYRISVPASWPVYHLSADPARCVLLNRNAVYLGTPGARQRCPARAYGHADAVLVQPEPSALPPRTVVLPAGTAALPATLPARAAAMDQANHTLRVSAPGPGVLVTASYGSDQKLIRSILAGATMTSTTRATAKASPGKAAQPSPAQPSRAQPGELTGLPGRGLGFDACTAPSVTTMTDWLASPYRVIGTYLGGENWACTYGNFSSAWVTQVASEGWRYIPIWVGLQAPCSTIPRVAVINPAQAAQEGQADAASAAATAQSFGYGQGSPIYFDMEGYNSSNTTCAQAVLTFLGAWTQGLHAAGYLSGVYSSAGSGIADLASEYGSPDYASPDDVWIADWNGSPGLSDPYLPDSDWPGQRLHQYYGGHNETWGGVTLNIDSDSQGGAVAGLAGVHQTRRPALLGEPDALPVAPGQSGTAVLVVRGAARAPAAVSWQAHAPAGLTITPGQGTTFVPPGAVRIVPLRVTAGASLAPGRYQVPVTATAAGQVLTETFELVSVVQAGATLPTSYPVVLYAADPASMAVATATARTLALPPADVTGSFSQAWTDVSGGADLVLAVGQAAGDALNFNACGWSNPAGEAAGSTPFFDVGVPLRSPPGADIFEPAGGSSTFVTAQLTGQLAQYALAGTLPDDGGPPVGPAAFQDTCLGSPDVTVPPATRRGGPGTPRPPRGPAPRSRT